MGTKGWKQLKNGHILTERMNDMKYQATGTQMWDGWFLNDNGRIHMYHMQVPKKSGGQEINPCQMTTEQMQSVGHAYTDDLIHWTECPAILPPLFDQNPDDYHQKFTGCAVQKDGKYYVYYRSGKNVYKWSVQYLEDQQIIELQHVWNIADYVMWIPLAAMDVFFACFCVFNKLWQYIPVLCMVIAVLEFLPYYVFVARLGENVVTKYIISCLEDKDL